LAKYLLSITLPLQRFEKSRLYQKAAGGGGGSGAIALHREHGFCGAVAGVGDIRRARRRWTIGGSNGVKLGVAAASSCP
jgi:hypothetical protein